MANSIRVCNSPSYQDCLTNIVKGGRFPTENNLSKTFFFSFQQVWIDLLVSLQRMLEGRLSVKAYMYSVCKEDHDCIFSQESSFVSELFSTLPYFSLPSTWNPLPSPPPRHFYSGWGVWVEKSSRWAIILQVFSNHHWGNPRETNYRECSNIKAQWHVSAVAGSVPSKMARGSRKFQHLAGVEPILPDSQWLALLSHRVISI